MIKRYFINEKSNANFKSFTVNWYLLIVLLFSLTPLKFLLQIFSALADGTAIVNLTYQLVDSVICAIIFVAILIQQTDLKDDETVDNNGNYSTEKDNSIATIWKMKIDQLELNQADKQVEKRIAIKMDYYIAKINAINYETTILLKKNATINDLALELKIPKSHLIFIFKYNSTINFVAFKNRIRIEQAKKLIKNGYLDTNTLNSLAKNIGFSSYDPFFKSFKEYTTIGPMEYGIHNKKNSK
jgi:AraC-like DNA-binding protein